MGPLATLPAWGHAALERSEPAANAQLAAVPAEIRLWFTEPLEPQFSGFELRDASGAPAAPAVGRTDPADPYQLVMQPGPLPDGLYTVVWWNTSAADGHHTEGSFPFTIGAPPAATIPFTTTLPVAAAGPSAETIPLPNMLARWLNFASLALAVGGLAFLGLVWRPAVAQPLPPVERRMMRVVWSGWLLAGGSALLLLAAQTATMANLSLREVMSGGALLDVLTGARFGLLWSARMALWLCMAALLLLAHRYTLAYWGALASASLMLLPTSLYSHAAAAQDAAASILADWVHLLLTTLWLGGLVQLFVVVPAIRRAAPQPAPLLARVVGAFSNYARLAVIGLAITGLYAAWLHAGSVEALLTTQYGRLLLVKLMLLVPLLAVAGVNLVWTYRRLLAGQEIWAGRLRGLVGGELALAATILLAAGAMTSISPARAELAQRAAAEAAAEAAAAAAAALAPEPTPIEAMQMADDLHIHLAISPGWVGENTFRVTLTTLAGEPVDDASLIRLRFEHQTQNLGRSELRITGGDTEGDGGVYTVRGANLSAPGDWQIRMTIQRPDQFDSVVDFTPHVELAPTPALPAVSTSPSPAPSPVETTPTLPYRTEVMAATGLLAIGVGGYRLGRRFRPWQGSRLLALMLLGLGGVFLVSALLV
ncbi:MAG TPA: copper resistance protein CopC [Caldilineaceae bacterium]|nr:copper resistance protein CopC [Caldilineaceae bacterium]